MTETGAYLTYLLFWRSPYYSMAARFTILVAAALISISLSLPTISSRPPRSTVVQEQTLRLIIQRPGRPTNLTNYVTTTYLLLFSVYMSISLGRAPKILWAAIEVTVGAGI